MPCPTLILSLSGALTAWLLFALFCRSLNTGPRDDLLTGLVWRALHIYVRLVHRVKYEGLEHIPAWSRGQPPIGPLLVVSNHTAGIDPALIQAACDFEIRWMMMREMMPASFNAVWDWMQIIAVGTTGTDTQSARTAIRHLKDGGVVGLFPEGAIERPPGVLLPFAPGAGLLISRASAKVLLVVIDGTPVCDSAYMSVLTPSHARVRFLGLIDYANTKLSAAEIAADLQARVQSAM